MIKSKQGLGIGQVFIFIIAALTFALIMIFGYKTVVGFLQRGEEVQFYQFKTDLESSIQSIYTEFDAVRIEQFQLPPKYRQICFVNMDAEFDASLCQHDPLACDVWQDSFKNGAGYQNTDENVFLVPPAPLKLRVSKIGFGEESYLCLPINNGVFRLYLGGKGSYTYLAEPVAPT